MIPTVEDISIAQLGITLRDMNRVPKQVGIQAERILVQVLQHQVLQRQRPDTKLCMGEQFEHENELYAEAATQQQGLTFTDHREQAGDAIVIDDSDCDPRLQIKKFLVMADPRLVIGTFTLSNIIVERDEEIGITASAMAMPGCNPAPGQNMRQTWTGIMRHIIEEDLAIAGRIVDFVEWRFPTRTSHRWMLTLEEAARIDPTDSAAAIPSRGLEVADLGDHDLTKDLDGTPVRVRRLGAPRAPSAIRG